MEWNTKEQAIFDEFTNNSEKFAFAFLTGRGEEMFSDEVKADEEIDYFALDNEITGHFALEMVEGWKTVDNMANIASVDKLSTAVMAETPEKFFLAEGRSAFESGILLGKSIRKEIENSWK